MNKSQLDVLVKDLSDLVPDDDRKKPNPLREDSLDMLHNDVENEYLKKYDEMDSRYANAWDLVVYIRLKSMRVPDRIKNNGKEKSKFEDLVSKWGRQVPTSFAIGLVYFGQKRINSNFAESQSVEQKAVVGLPSINGRPLQVIAGQFSNGDLKADQNPIKIFFSERHMKWVAANNRSYAIHCLAGVKPLRYWPGKPSSAETNRLDETMEQGEASAVRGLLTLPRILPSLEMPMTDGINQTAILAVAKVPPTFYVDGSR
jgi:hypothetical protein